MYEVVLSFYSYGWNQPRDHSNAKCWTVLSCSTVYCAVRGGSSFFVCVWNLVCHQSNGSHWAVLWFDSFGHALLKNLPCSMQLFCSRTFKNSSTAYYPYVRYKIGIFALENPRTCSLHFDRFSSIAFFFCSLILIRDKHSFVPIGRPGYKTEIESSGKRGCDGGD